MKSRRRPGKSKHSGKVGVRCQPLIRCRLQLQCLGTSSQFTGNLVPANAGRQGAKHQTTNRHHYALAAPARPSSCYDGVNVSQTRPHQPGSTWWLSGLQRVVGEEGYDRYSSYEQQDERPVIRPSCRRHLTPRGTQPGSGALGSGQDQGGEVIS
jgi:hypothetical protein